jgi:hypothetical protein
MQDTIEAKPTNGHKRESYIKFEAEQKRAEKEPELFPTPKPANQKPEKNFLEKASDMLHWFLNSDDPRIMNILLGFALTSQSMSHTIGFVAMMSKFREVSNWFSVPFGFFASVIFEGFLHHLASKGAVGIPVSIAFISGIFSMYAWSGLLSSGIFGFFIGTGISFIPPFVVYWSARNNYKEKKNKELEKEIAEANEKQALEKENAERKANGEQPKEKPKNKRARKITKEEKLVIIKAILDNNMNDFEKVRIKFDVGMSTAFTLLALASKIRARKQKEISVNSASLTDR